MEEVKRKDGEWTQAEIKAMLAAGVSFETKRSLEPKIITTHRHPTTIEYLKKIENQPPNVIYHTYGRILFIKHVSSRFNFDITIEHDGHKLDCYYNNPMQKSTENFSSTSDDVTKEVEELICDVEKFVLKAKEEINLNFQNAFVEGAIISFKGILEKNSNCEEGVFKMFDYRIVENAQEFNDHLSEVTYYRKNQFDL